MIQNFKKYSTFNSVCIGKIIKDVIEATKLSILNLEDNLDENLILSWTKHIINSKGRLVLSGMGKSGLIAQKISATMASIGCPSFYLHPTDALHGDLGMVLSNDTVLILSNSGESEEIVKLLPNLLKLDIKIGAITSKSNSILGKSATWCFTYVLPKGEGCPINVAPMASTTTQLLIGDLLASCHMYVNQFTMENFAQFHPGGSIGNNFLKVHDLFHKTFPKVSTSTTLIDTLITMTQGKLGMTTVVDDENNIIGVISDGDVRRAMQKQQNYSSQSIQKLNAGTIMTTNPIYINSTHLATEAARLMKEYKITFLVVKAEDDKPCGVIHIHDLHNLFKFAR